MANFITGNAIIAESKELRPYKCLWCGHLWYEDCDASDYPEYCPECGDALKDDESEAL